MKPIFEEERQFFLKKTGIELPTDCWRDGSNIYLDPYCDKPLYRFRVENKIISIVKDNNELFKNYKQIKLQEVVERERERVDFKFSQDVEWLRKNIQPYKSETIILGYSGGKDSDLLKVLVDNAGIEYILNFANTSNDCKDTYLHLKDTLKTVKNYKIMNPKEGFYQWIKRQDYFIPNVLTRNCCATFKEGQLTKEYDTKKPLIDIVGLRRCESFKRSKYEKIMDNDFEVKLRGKNSQPKLWVKIAPIVDWTDLEVWVYLLDHNVKINQSYKYGFERCGCLICPYQSNYVDMLIEEFYPKMWRRWIDDILVNTYKHRFVKSNLKWSLDEWVNGKWKTGTSKEYEIITKSPTTNRIKLLSEIKGCSEDVAIKYFKKQCCQCEKKLNPNEVGMNLKMIGRDIQSDKMLCKGCMCKKFNWTTKDYNNKVIEFRDGGCTLF